MGFYGIFATLDNDSTLSINPSKMDELRLRGTVYTFVAFLIKKYYDLQNNLTTVSRN
jgi:hypothetical protein